MKMTMLGRKIDNYTKYMTSKGNSKRTIATYEKYLRDFDDYLVEVNCKLKNITNNIIENFINSLELSNSSKNLVISAIRSFYNYLEKFGEVESNPSKAVETIKVGDRKPVFLTEQDIKAGLESIVGRKNYQLDRTLFVTGVFTGLRLSELTNLKLEDITFSRDKENGMIRVIGKGNKERIIPLHHMVEDNIKVLVNGRTKGYVFEGVYNKNNHISKKYVDFLLTDIGEYISKDISPHAMRHTMATLLMKNGANIFTIKEILGHESLKTTEIYLHLDMDAKQQAVNNIAI